MIAQPDCIQRLEQSRRTIMALLDRAVAEPVFLAELAADPLGTAVRAGVRLTTADVKQLLGLPSASDEELVEVLRARIAAVPGASCGCGG
jgi:hypothetical protein